MKKGKWFYEALVLFKQWRKDNGKIGECSRQIITQSSLEETWTVWSENGGIPEVLNLIAYKNTGEVYLLPKYGGPKRIYLKDERAKYYGVEK